MNKTKKAKIFIEAALVIAVTLALIMPASAVITNKTTDNGTSIKIVPINTPISNAGSLATGNILLTADNPDEDDQNPKILKDGAGNILVVYEKIKDTFTIASELVFTDDGNTWYLAYDFDSTDWDSGSGELISGDICYNPNIDKTFWCAIDTIGDMYNLRMTWLEGNIVNAGDVTIYGVSGTGATEHYEGSCTNVGEWAITPYICDEPDYNLEHCPGLGYWDADFEHPDIMGGFYYDGGSILDTTPASNIEAETGIDRMYMVMQVDDKIAFKATVTDPALLQTNGGGPGGMDKYADIECWPWQNWIATENAEDPDVSGDAGKVCVVYSQDGMVKCAYSNDVVKEYEEEIEFQVSEIDEGNYPTVYMSGNEVYVGYVKSGNLYFVQSSDGGATWGTPAIKNEVDGTVVEQYGTCHIDSVGIVWTDSRNENYDVYYDVTSYIPEPKIDIEQISGGLGVSAVITNNGDAPATNVEWSITLDGTVFLGAETTKTISSIAVGDSVPIKSGFPLGFGPIDITITAQSAEGPSDTETASGKLLLFFITGL